MSRKWNPFSRKKGSKADSHGTTLANEEMEFQPAVRPGQESQWKVNSLSTAVRNRDSFPNPALVRDDRKNNPTLDASYSTKVVPDQSDNVANNSSVESDVLTKIKLNNEVEQTNQHKHPSHLHHGKNALDSNKNDAFDPHPLVPVANISRTSPRVAKKLIKPGGVNSQQPPFLPPGGNNNMIVSISDEYTDPFDAVNSKKSTADGYVEPYVAKQLYEDATHSSGEGGIQTDHSRKKLYDEPWDKSGQLSCNNPDYEEPWDNSETLPFAMKRPHNAAVNPKAKNFAEKHGELVMEYPVLGGSSHSGDSSASSSSASLAKQRMVRVEASPRHSPHDSPRHSPKLDKRLIKPKESELSYRNVDPRLQLYSVPGGGSKYKPVDHRLIKAEPSLGEMRRSSPNVNQTSSSKSSTRTNSPVGSSRGSLNHSPVSTLVIGEMMDHLTNDALRRSSSPLVQPMNVSRYLLNKAKSRSLDIRNRQFPPNVRGASGAFMPKSASDNQLTQSAFSNNVYKGNGALGGVKEYEEPWDTNGHQEQNKIGRPPCIVHSRSRSYELSYPATQMYTKHEKSQSFDNQLGSSASGGNGEYESPWDQHEVVPKTHLESMQRFQDRRLELHPSEAIGRGDFSPLVPLEKQSWFHGSITREEANRRLEKQMEGSYLVRNSESIPNNYSLSLRTEKETIHMVISRTRDGFWILGEFSAPFHSIPEMVTSYAAHRLKINDVQHISLRYPVPDEFL